MIDDSEDLGADQRSSAFTSITIEYAAPLGPAKTVILRTETGDVLRFDVAAGMPHDEGMSETLLLAPPDTFPGHPPITEPTEIPDPTVEEIEELRRRFADELDKPHQVKVLPPFRYQPQAGETINVGGARCILNQWVHAADKIQISATRLNATPARPAGSAVLIDIPAMQETQ